MPLLALFIKVRAIDLLHLESLSERKKSDNGQNQHLPAAGDSLKSFLYAIKSKATKERYIAQLRYFFDFLKILPGETLEEQASRCLGHQLSDHKRAHDCLIDYVTHLKGRVDAGEITGGTVGNYYSVVKLFYDVNDIELNWKRIERGLPETGAVANDRAPTLEEIRKIIEYPDRRIKVLVLIMVSSGIRIGAWENLKLKHITPLYSPKNDKVVIAAKLAVYEGRPKPYFTFVTPEAYQAVQDYVDFRKLHGEKITPESWVLRDKFETTGESYQSGAKIGLVTVPKKLEISGIKKILIRAMRSQGIRQSPLEQGVKRYEFKLAHGYRKYFMTNCERAMKPFNVAKLTDHKTGIRDHYIRYTEDELLADYLKAVEFLSVNRDQRVATQLQKQVVELTERQEQENSEILGRLTEKEKEAEVVKKQLEELKQNQDKMIESAKVLARMGEYFYQYRDDQLPQNMEIMLQGFLYGDSEEGHPYVSQEEFAKRRRGFPQLVAALEKLRETQLADPNYYDANGERVLRRFGEDPPPPPHLVAEAAANKETKKKKKK